MHVYTGATADLVSLFRYKSSSFFQMSVKNIKKMLIISNYYRPQRSCGKVMFSQASVILFTGECIPACTGADTPWQTPPWADTPQADTPLQTPMTATAADGMHPTGMHSCLFNTNMNGTNTKCYYIWLTALPYWFKLVYAQNFGNSGMRDAKDFMRDDMTHARSDQKW